MADEVNTYRLGDYRIGTNLPFRQGAVWDNVARASRWGAGTIELNTSAETLGKNALQVLKEQAKINNLVYTWHVPPAAEQAGELAVPNDQRANAFAREVLAQAMQKATEVGAKHVTFHPTLQAARPDPDKMWIYDPREDNVKPARLIKGLDREASLEVLNQGAKAQLQTQISNVESEYNIVRRMEETSKAIHEEGANLKKADMLRYLTIEASKFGGAVSVQPEDPSIWMRIQDKALRGTELNDDEKRTVEDYSRKIIDKVGAYKQYFKSQLDQLRPWASRDQDLVMDGEKKMMENVAQNIAMLPTEVLKNAVDNKLSIGFENLPGTTLFSTPGELSKLRELTVKKLVEENKLTEKEAKDLIGFTFDFAHANITKNMNIAGADFTTIPEFIQKLGKDSIKHIHAVDNIGLVDAHLPLGQGELGTLNKKGEKEVWNNIVEALRKVGFHGTSVFELGQAELPVTYAVSHEFMEPGMYTVAGIPGSRTTSFWGPSYVEASMTDPLMMQKDQGYFYESFVDVF